MSEVNIEIVRRGIEACLRKPKPDFETVNALYHSDHRLVTRTGTLEGAPVEGASGFRAWLARMDETGDWQGEVEEVRVAPDGRLVATIRFRMKTQRSDSAVDLRSANVIDVRDGKIWRTEIFSSSRAALEAVGLRE
jgi:ketosteroid isomerase-like protein